MKKISIAIGCFFLVVLGIAFRSKKMEIILAFPSWKASEETIAAIPYDHITGVIWAFALPKVDGSIELTNEKYLTILAKQTTAKGKWIVLGVGGANSSLAFHEIVQSGKKSKHFAQQVKEICDTYHLQGVQIDFEAWPSSQAVDTVLSKQFFEFGKILRQYLPVAKYQIAYDVYGSNWYGKHFPVELSAYADRLNVMAMDATGSWSDKGDPAPIELTESSIRYWKNRFRPEDHGKLTLVVPLYGKVFYKQHKKGMTVNSKSYKEIVSAYGFIQQDFIELNDSVLWYNSLTTIKNKKLFAEKENLLGLSFWQSTYDSVSDSMSVIKNIDK